MESYDATRSLPVGVKTLAASASAASFRIMLLPVDTLKTMMQVSRWTPLRLRLRLRLRCVIIIIIKILLTLSSADFGSLANAPSAAAVRRGLLGARPFVETRLEQSDKPTNRKDEVR